MRTLEHAPAASLTRRLLVLAEGVTKASIRKLARRGGVKRISSLIYEETVRLSHTRTRSFRTRARAPFAHAHALEELYPLTPPPFGSRIFFFF